MIWFCLTNVQNQKTSSLSLQFIIAKTKKSSKSSHLRRCKITKMINWSSRYISALIISHISCTSHLNNWLTCYFLSSGRHVAAQGTRRWVTWQEACWQICVSRSGTSFLKAVLLSVKCQNIIMWWTGTFVLIQDEKRPIRRVRSPSRPRAWMSGSYKPKLGGHFYKPR